MEFETTGHCPVCESTQRFFAQRDGELSELWYPHWFRGGLKCQSCSSLPRERALAHVLHLVSPKWREAAIHESSPSGTLSAKFRRECPAYLVTQYDPGMPFGTTAAAGWRNEDLQNQTFEDDRFDIVITQDVFEHIFEPGRAAREIARTLKPGGLAIMTVPVVKPWGETQRRAGLVDGKVVHFLPEQYHGNPVGDGRALVTVDWGPEIAGYLSQKSGLAFAAWFIDDMRLAVRDPYNVVLVGRKGPVAELGE